MADDNQRPFRAKESYGRPAAGGVAAGNDPLAELARLIGQTDPFSEFGRDGRRAAPQPVRPQQPSASARNAPPSQNYGADQFGSPDEGGPPHFGAQHFQQSQATPQQYGAQQFSAGSDLYRTGFENPALDHHQPAGYDATAYYQDAAASAPHGDEMYDDVPPARRRISVIAIAGVFALAVIGTAGAFGYRALFGSSGSTPPPVIKADTAPSKIVPSNSEPQSNKLITDRAGDRGEKLMSREEQPIDLKDRAPQAVFPNAPKSSNEMTPPQQAPASATGEPKKVRTIAIRPDQLNAAPDGMSVPARAAAAPPAKPVPTPRAAADDARQVQAPAPSTSPSNGPSHFPGIWPDTDPADSEPPEPTARQRAALAQSRRRAGGGPGPGSAAGAGCRANHRPTGRCGHDRCCRQLSGAGVLAAQRGRRAILVPRLARQVSGPAWQPGAGDPPRRSGRQGHLLPRDGRAIRQFRPGQRTLRQPEIGRRAVHRPAELGAQARSVA